MPRLSHAPTRIGILLALFLFMLLLAKACSSPVLPEPAIVPTPVLEVPYLTLPASALLISDDLLPARYRTHSCDPDCDRLEGPDYAERYIIRRKDPVGHHIHMVYRFADNQAAATYLLHLKRVYNLQEKSGLLYHSTYTTDEVGHCVIGKIAFCRIVSRYNNILSEWYIQIDDGDTFGMTPDEADRVLATTDRALGRLLGLPRQQ